MASGSNNPLQNQSVGGLGANPLIDYNPPLYANPTPFDILFLGTDQVPCPGYCRVHQWKRKEGWDIKKGKGVQGATLTHAQRPPMQGGVTFYLWTAQHFLDWETFRPLFLYDPTKIAIQAIPITHPALQDLGVKSIVTEFIGSIVDEGGGLFSLEVELIEYLPPPAVDGTSTPTGATLKANPKAPTPPSPLDSAEQKFAAKWAQASQP